MSDDEPNEILAATREAKATRERAKQGEMSNWPIGIAVGVGIGSAALAAALLYGRSKGKKD